MGSKNPRRYTPEEKKKAIQRTIEVGVATANSELGIPMGTLSSWEHYARKARLENSPDLTPSDSTPPTPAALPTQASPQPVTASEPATTPPPLKGHQRNRIAKIYTPSQVAQALERLAAIGLRPAATELGISRNTLKDWERKAHKAAEGQGPSPTSGPDPNDVEAKRDEAIRAEWEKQRGLGPSQIRNQLRRQGIRVSVHTVRRVMEDAGYRPPKVERREHTGEYEAVRPGQLWHMDFLHRFIHTQKVFLLAFIDDFSRYVPGWALDDAERADAVIAAFEAAVARHGKPEAVMSDGGSAFWSWKGSSRFTRILEEYGIDQLIATTPQLNGKSEVFNANIQKELFNRVIFADVADLRRHLGPHFHWYNHHRTHHALGGLLVPADRYYGRVDEVMARIESGAGVSDPLDLATRTLDLFRVVSHQGKSEIWLMGRKILEMK